MITFSIVSHNQIDLCIHAIKSIFKHIPDSKIILTINVDENIDSFEKEKEKNNIFTEIKLIKNKVKKGFGANHNQAFKLSETRYFCVCNPDIEILKFDISLDKIFNENTAAMSPSIFDPSMELEDNLRLFPTYKHLIFRFLGQNKVGSIRYEENNFDWVSAIFLICDSEKFENIGGFDEDFFMYYEDADLCRRFSKAGYEILVSREAKVIHDARRDSRKKIQHLIWHIKSAFRIINLLKKEYSRSSGKLI